MVFDIVVAPRIHQGSYILIFRYLPSWEVLHLQSVILESKRTLEVPEWSLGGFEMVGALRTHTGSFISILKSLPSWKVVHYVSPKRHHGV